MTHGTDVPPPPRGRPTAARAAAIDEAILTAARLLFLQIGYAETTMDAVAAAAAVSKGTLYARHPGKSDLFSAVVADRVDTWRTLARASLAEETATDVSERLLARAIATLRGLRMPEIQAFYRLLTAEAPRFPELARAFYDLGYRPNIATIAGYLRDAGRADGRPPEAPEAVAKLFASGLSGWFHAESALRTPTDAECCAFAAHAVAVVIGGRDSW